MTNFTEALQEKIDELEDEKERIDEKIDLLRELMSNEEVSDHHKRPKKVKARRSSGRPKGSKNKKIVESKHAPKDELYAEAMKQVAKLEDGGTSVELQQQRTASFNPTPRSQNRTPSNVHAGTKKDVNAARELVPGSNRTITIDENDLDG